MPSNPSRRAGRALAVGLFAATGFLASVAAQRPVFTVGGVNPDYATLPAAVAAVPPGSILVVRPGVHTGFTTGKPLRVLLDFDLGAGSIQPASGAAYTITLTGLPGTDGFVLVGRGGSIAPGTVGAIRVHNVAAPVVVENVTVPGAATTAGLTIVNAPAVHVRRSVLGGTPGLQASYTNLVLSECVVLSPFGVGAVVHGSRLDAVRTFFTGTNQPALRLLDCDARLSSDGTSLIQTLSLPTLPVSPLEAFDCALQFDPTRIGLVPVGTTAAFTLVNCVLEDDEVPTLVTTQASPGATAGARMTSATPRPGVVVLGDLRPTAAFFGTTNIWVDTITAPLVVAVGICDSVGLTSQTLIPTTPALRGGVFCLQGVVWQPNGWPVLSGPGLWAIL